MVIGHRSTANSRFTLINESMCLEKILQNNTKLISARNIGYTNQILCMFLIIFVISVIGMSMWKSSHFYLGVYLYHIQYCIMIVVERITLLTNSSLLLLVEIQLFMFLLFFETFVNIYYMKSFKRESDKI